jgi:hypothetical protein
MAKYVTDTALSYTISQLSNRIDKTFTKRIEAINSLELVMAVPTDKIDTSTTLEQCLRITYVDNYEQLDENDDQIEHIIDLSLESLKTSELSFSNWEKSKDYKLGDYVVYDYKLYQANEDHTSSINFDSDINSWNLILGGGTSSVEIEDWISNHDYYIGDRVKYNNVIYECIIEHTSSTDFELDKYKWIILLEHYYNLSQDQYDDMIKSGIITESNKYLYVVNDGTDSNNKEYEEDITIASEQWTIQHNLNTEYFRLDTNCLDEEGNYIEGDINTTLTTLNLLVIDFCLPVKGKIYIKNK